jgi:hypothetical protein
MASSSSGGELLNVAVPQSIPGCVRPVCCVVIVVSDSHCVLPDVLG